ncbi:MAG: M48 family metallopeptidase [Rhodospirillales bacterium]|nr:MAG: M48 family metallopeptidase [Rhodospirillales bacterium]
MADNRTIELGGRAVALVVRRSKRARRLALRIPGHDDSVELVLPMRAPEADGLAFLRSRSSWVLDRLDRLPPRVPFADGAELPLGGVPHRLRWHPGDGPPVAIDGHDILVAGRQEHMARRFRDWLHTEARRRITPLARDKAAMIAAPVTRITIRDQKSRWGSCAPGGRLSFNWRLVLAPPPVLDYVVAHEVAHLSEPNHSPAFWRLVDRLTEGRETGRDWLRRHGPQLHRYG